MRDGRETRLIPDRRKRRINKAWQGVMVVEAVTERGDTFYTEWTDRERPGRHGREAQREPPIPQG